MYYELLKEEMSPIPNVGVVGIYKLRNLKQLIITNENYQIVLGMPSIDYIREVVSQLETSIGNGITKFKVDLDSKILLYSEKGFESGSIEMYDTERKHIILVGERYNSQEAVHFYTFESREERDYIYSIM
ncbi:hypothetical protein [Paraclostridium bifermentans]|uniref:hypothetical protein n=1 Tax=Paraclostridium bifermentans TaxID=1490 RepID=UPI001FF27F27|nr:hypothetical protein [Paraclostridium bifermentans]UOW69706.1 hypothetical protein MTR78_17510 [Paraclostridium bifermentans]